MSDFYTDDEQLERLKAWWREYGNAVLVGLLLGAVLVAGYQYWRSHQLAKAEAASVLYEQLRDSLSQHQYQQAKATGEFLLKDYAGTAYAPMAALLLARAEYDTGDQAAARRQLEWALAHAGGSTAIANTARLRLARILEGEGKVDAALKLVDISRTDGFTADYQELKGDLLLAKHDREGARQAYQAALAALSPDSGYRRVLQMKLDDLGPAPKGQP